MRRGTISVQTAGTPHIRDIQWGGGTASALDPEMINEVLEAMTGLAKDGVR